MYYPENHESFSTDMLIKKYNNEINIKTNKINKLQDMLDDVDKKIKKLEDYKKEIKSNIEKYKEDIANTKKLINEIYYPNIKYSQKNENINNINLDAKTFSDIINILSVAANEGICDEDMLNNIIKKAKDQNTLNNNIKEQKKLEENKENKILAKANPREINTYNNIYDFIKYLYDKENN